MFAEFFGKETGYCRGRGGSMHIADVEAATSAPTASSAAACRSRRARRWPRSAAARDRRDASCFFGDGATNEGAFHEALNMAAIWKLPVVFVCENNQYAMSTSTERSRPRCQAIADRAGGLLLCPASPSTATTCSAVAEAIDAAVARARAGEGPTPDRGQTYRWRGHSKSDRNRYRTKDEIEELDAARPDRALPRRADRARPASRRGGRRDRAGGRGRDRRRHRVRQGEPDAARPPSSTALRLRRERAMTAQDRVVATREMTLRRGDPRSDGAGAASATSGCS